MSSKMTTEEAGEEILSGPDETCPKCGGGGGIPQDESANVFNICSRCNGFGKTMRSAYIEAAIVLGVPMPIERSKFVPIEESTFIPPGYYDD